MCDSEVCLELGVDRTHDDLVAAAARHPFRLTGLTSEKGQKLNGSRVRVLSWVTNKAGERRFVCVPEGVDSKGNELLIKYCNLESEKDGHPVAPGMLPGLPTEEVMPVLADAVSIFSVTAPAFEKDRPDCIARYKQLQDSVASGKPPEALRCMDMGVVPRSRMNPGLKRLAACTPPCAGDRQVDFRRFGDGMRGGPGESCAICLEPFSLSNTDDELLGLGCLHVFHRSCMARWEAEGSSSCPTCRKEQPGIQYIKTESNRQRVLSRVLEYIQSGMCERCSATYIEQDPLVKVRVPDVSMPMMVLQSQVGSVPGATVIRSMLGSGLDEPTHVPMRI